MTDRSLQAAALIDAGFSVIPILPDGSKKPPVGWKRFQSEYAKPWQLRAWFRDTSFGIGILTGKISGNLEVLDFDAGEVFQPWRNLAEALAPGVLATLPIIATPSGGYHVYLRCQDAIAGNQKLARRWYPDKPPTVKIETRGEGGYVLSSFCPPECHALHRTYRLIEGDLCDIPPISGPTREMILQAARAFNEYLESPPPPPSNGHHQGDRPGDRFNHEHSWQEILEPFGWVIERHQGAKILWRRPGKDAHERGWSATSNYEDHDTFHVFSTNAFPFEAGRGYTKFSAFALLKYGGDFHAAAQAVVQQQRR